MDSTTKKMDASSKKLNKRISRRISQRKQYKLYTQKYKELQKQFHSITTREANKIIQKRKRFCFQTFGFHCDPNNPPWTHIKNTLLNTPPTIYFNKPTTSSFHNLCSPGTPHPPQGISTLLGLGSKFCVQNPTINKNTDDTIEKLRRDVRIKYMIKESPEDQSFNHKLYVKNKTWQPPHASPEIEIRLNQFHTLLTNEINNKIQNHKRSTNITNIQSNAIKHLRSNEDFIIVNTDKNLGPAILRRKDYIAKIYDEHLSDKDTYEQTTEEIMTNKLNEIKQHVKDLLIQFQDSIAHSDLIYLRRSLHQDHHRTPQFYGNPKVHKPGKLKTRPIVSQAGSFLASLSTYCDYHLQKLTSLVPTYTQRSDEVKTDLENLGKIPRKAKLFKLDATSMYTNIKPTHGIETLHNWFITFPTFIPKDIPTTFILELVKIILTNNFFKFGNTSWAQKSGIAMGTPMACILATLYFGFYEKTYLLQKYAKNLLFFKRQIDDILGIWVDHHDSDNTTTWDNFLQDVNNFGSLQWNLEEVGQQVNFLDITVRINENQRIETKTYQKPMNLFLYIPPFSAHPPGVRKGLIYGTLRTYWKQNSKPTDFQHFTRLFYHRLLARGYHPHSTKQIFYEAAKQIEAAYTQRKPNHTDKTKNKTKRLNEIYLHRQYHPKDISRSHIQNLFHTTCMTYNELGQGFDKYDGLNIDKLTVAYSRPKNLRDILIPSTLFETATISAQQIIDDIKHKKNHG